MPDDISPEDLLGYLQKKIQERETKWNEVGRSIRILREAEQVLRQNSPPSSNASAEASPPAEKEGSVSSSETGTPIPIEAEPFVLLEEESEGSFAREPQDGPEEKSEISMEEIPRNYGENLLEPGRAEESQEILHQTDIPEEPKKSARMPMEDLLPEEQSKLLDGEEVHSNRLIPPKFSSPIEITEIEENPPLANIGPIRAEKDKGRKIPSDSSLNLDEVEQAPVLLLSKRESTPPGNISPATKKKPPASATSRLLEYIRGGGRVEMPRSLGSTLRRVCSLSRRPSRFRMPPIRGIPPKNFPKAPSAAQRIIPRRGSLLCRTHCTKGFSFLVYRRADLGPARSS